MKKLRANLCILLMVFMVSLTTLEIKAETNVEKNYEIDKSEKNYEIDKSEMSKGIINFFYKGKIEPKMKVRLGKNGLWYVYDLNKDELSRIPLQLGEGNYEFQILQNIHEDTYSVINKEKIELNMLENENSVFLTSNVKVPYDENGKYIKYYKDLLENSLGKDEKDNIEQESLNNLEESINKSTEVIKDNMYRGNLFESDLYIKNFYTENIIRDKNINEELIKKFIEKNETEKKVEIVYKDIVKNYSYDFEKLPYLPNTYTPNLDEIYESKKAICYDYACLFAAVLRTEGIPTKLIMGYSDYTSEYHAWNEVYINGNWVLIDLTVDAAYERAGKYYNMEKEKDKYRMNKEY